MSPRWNLAIRLALVALLQLSLSWPQEARALVGSEWSSAEVDVCREEATVYLELESLLGQASKETEEQLGDHRSFLERSTAAMYTKLEELLEDHTSPESSSRAEERAASSQLIRQLLSAYHAAVLGELGQLRTTSDAIGNKLALINRSLGCKLISVNKYLAALFDVCQGESPSQPAPADERNWFGKLLADIGL